MSAIISTARPSARPRATRLAVSLLALLAVAAPAHAVVGGRADPQDEAFTVMVLWRDGPKAGFCSGVVVAQDAVLTAAHCAPPGADVTAHFRQDGAPVLVPVAGVTRHPDYHADAIRTRQRSVDLAVLRLKAPLPDRFRPATLADGSGAGTMPGTPYRVSGFGLSSEAQPTTGGTLRSVAVEATRPLSTLLLWAHGARGPGGACTGDSGGPVVDSAGRVAAVVAWAAGHGGTGCGELTQAIWVGPYRAWIAGAAASP